MNSPQDKKVLQGIKVSLTKDNFQIDSMEDVAYNRGVAKAIEMVGYYLSGKLSDAQLKRYLDLEEKN